MAIDKRVAQMLGGPLCGRMCSNTEMQNAPVVRQYQEHVQDLEPDGRNLKKSMEIMVFILVFEQRPLVCNGGLRRARHLLTLVSPMSMPSLSNSR